MKNISFYLSNISTKDRAKRLNIVVEHLLTFSCRTMLIGRKFGFGQTCFPPNGEVKQMLVRLAGFSTLQANNATQYHTKTLECLACTSFRVHDLT